MEIRALSPDDYDRIIELWKASGLPYKPRGRDSRSSMQNEMEAGAEIFLGAFIDGKLIGVCIGTDDGRKGWINRLAVHPEFGGKGLGRMLVAAVEEKLKNIGRKVICTLVEDWNEESLNFFEKCGYVIHRDIYYLSKRESKDD